jgi:uncharacterized protein
MENKFVFEWDHAKALNNKEKHGVSFDEAATVFRDAKALSIFDPDHSESEDRWVTMGISGKGRLLVVIHTFRQENEGTAIIRIISSRKTTKHETTTYGE